MTAMTLIAAAARAADDVSLDDVPSSIGQVTTGAGTLDCSCGLELQSDGDLVRLNGNNQAVPTARTTIGRYASSGGGLEARFTQNTGTAVTLSSGSLGAWIALTSDLSVYLSDTDVPPASETANVTVDVRRGTTILDTATLDLNTTIDGL